MKRLFPTQYFLYSLVAIVAQFIFVPSIFAQTISVSSGVSQPAVVSGKTVKIYAGWANASSNCTTASSTSTCDTCLGGNNIPCNHASIHGNLYLQIDVASTTANISGLPVQLSTTSDSITPISGAVSSTATASGYSIKILWSDLCNSSGLGLDSTCYEGSAPYSETQTVFFGPVKESKFLETISVEINLSTFSSAVSEYTECASGATSASAGAACYFKLYPGDEKIYVDTFEPSWSVDAPTITIGSSTLPVRAVNFFAKETTAGNEATDFGAITTANDFFEIAIQNGEDALTDNRLIGFDNGAKYCLKMATQDITGNIQRFTPNATTSSMNDFCVTPNDVYGVLSDKDCFIATAAFGSPLNRHVQRFREFRNKFLVPYDWGKSFIKMYYKYGPKVAAPIKKDESLRSMARGILWPLLFFVEIFLQYGIFWGIFSILLSLLVLRKTVQLFKFRLLKRSN